MDKVLIVDDDANWLNGLQRELEKFTGQFAVVTAPDGAAALELMKKERISVLITDLEMPQMNGAELLSHMRQHRPQVPCIVMTEPNSAAALKSNEHVLGSIAKPFDANELFVLIMAGLEQIDEGTFWREQRKR